MTDIEAMRARGSVRTYDGTPLDGTLRSSVESLFEKMPEGPFGSKPRFVLVDPEWSAEKGIVVGTYGVIRGASGYLAPVVADSGDEATGDRILTDLGFSTEQAVLELTRMNMGTCWLGGTFRKSRFSSAAGVGEDERLRAVVAFGMPAQRRSLVDSVLYRSAGSSTRLPAREHVAVFGDDGQRWNDEARVDDAVPLDSIPGIANGSPLASAIEAVRRAPSASNKQPWRLLVTLEKDGAAKADLLLQRTSSYEALSGYRIQSIDAGIAAAHFELAAEELGLKPVRRFAPAPAGNGPFGSADFVLGWDLTF